MTSHSETFFGDVADFVEDFVDLAGTLDFKASGFFRPDLFGNEVRLACGGALELSFSLSSGSIGNGLLDGIVVAEDGAEVLPAESAFRPRVIRAIIHSSRR